VKVKQLNSTLQKLGHQTDRIGNIYDLTKRLVNGDCWDLVFNIAEGLHGIGRESQVPALLDAYNIPYTFSDPLVLSLTLHKGMTKRVLRDLGIPTPDFAEVYTEADIMNINLPFPLFAKPMADGTGKGITANSIIRNENELQSVCLWLLKDFRQPVLVETFLPGREFTVGIVGTAEKATSVGVMEVILNSSAEQGAYTYENKEHYEDLVRYRRADGEIAQQAVEIALAAWRGIRCRDCGRVDLRLDASGIPNLMEINPLAGINPVRSDLPIICSFYGISYKELIQMILESAAQRINLKE